jgi:hypothetical protein
LESIPDPVVVKSPDVQTRRLRARNRANGDVAMRDEADRCSCQGYRKAECVGPLATTYEDSRGKINDASLQGKAGGLARPGLVTSNS